MGDNYDIFNSLYKEGVLTRVEADDLIYKFSTSEEDLMTFLKNNSNIDENTLFRFLASHFGLEYHELNVVTINEEAFAKVPIEYLKYHRLIPINEDEDEALIGVTNPLEYQAASNLVYYFEKEINICLVSPTALDTVLTFFENKLRRKGAIANVDEYDFQPQTEEEEEFDPKLIDAPAIKLADSILREAVASKASDIHIEPDEFTVRIRFRIDGRLSVNSEIPPNLYNAVLARYKIMANLNIAERRLPQDGKITINISGDKYDFRISTLPVLYGEKIVIRIYDSRSGQHNFDALGLFDYQKEQMQKMIRRPHGIILITGPTGSGKSTTLYTFLRELNDESRNISTIEDPVENQISGLNQTQVNPKADLTFSVVLRALLRQDPNVIMVGEIRDEETATLAVRAAITGHLVLSTLHTNDAIGTVTRLVDMGIPSYLVADSMIGAVAQRLVRRLCTKCKRQTTTTSLDMRKLGITEPTTIYEPVGCPNCNGTGYRGRVGIFEIVTLDDEAKQIIAQPDVSGPKIYAYYESKGQEFLLENCQKRILEGVTSIEEYDDLVGMDQIEDMISQEKERKAQQKESEL